MAEQFRGGLDHVRVIPHIKDLRSWFEFSPATCAFIGRHPGVMQADVVQLFPASVDRLEAKGLPLVIEIFAALKRRGLRVCLVVANQWTNVPERKAVVEEFKAAARGRGLEPGVELVFTSDFHPDFEVGIPRRMVASCSSVPTCSSFHP